SAMRTTISVEFDQPVPQHVREQAAPASLNPAPQGQWVWTNPYTLKFLAQSPLPLDAEYALALNSTAFAGTDLAAEPVYALQTGNFQLEKYSITELASDAGPDMIELEGRLEFNGPVDPQALLDALRLNETNGTAIDLTLLTQWRSSSYRFRSAPVRKQASSRELTLSVASSLNLADKNLTLGQEFRQSIPVVLDPVLRVVSVSPQTEMQQSRMNIEFSAPVAASTLHDQLHLEPALPFTIGVHGKSATVNAAFVPGSTYTLRLDAGLTALDGARLTDHYSQAVYMPDLAPGVDFTAKGMFLPRQGQGLLGVEYVNTKTVNLTVNRIFANNLSVLFSDYGYSVFDQDFSGDSVPYHLGSEVYRQTLALSGQPNQKAEKTMSMSECIPDKRPGLYKVSLELPGEYRGATRWVLRTDIGLVAKQDETGLLVWATSLNTLKALDGVSIRLVSTKNQLLGVARTDAQGLAYVPVNRTDDEAGEPAMIQAMADDDFSFLFLERFQIDTTGLDVTGVALSPTGLQAYIYGQRDIYRPGETLNGIVLVRTQSLDTPPDQPLRLEQRDPQGRVLRTLNLAVRDGQASFSLDIPDWSLTGGYGLDVYSAGQPIGTYAYQVEAFVPDRISVELADTPPVREPGQNLPFTVRSRYLFGPPGAGLLAQTKVRLVSAPFAPQGFEDFVFGEPGRSFEPLTVLNTETRLDARGQTQIQVDLPTDLTPPMALAAELTSRVREQGGRGVTARRMVPVHAYAFYPGLRSPDSRELLPGKPVEIEFVTLTPDGKIAPHPELQATFIRDEWQTVMRKTETGFTHESVRHPVEVSTQRLAQGEGRGRVTIVAPDYGSYRLRLAAPDGAVSELELYCGGWGYSPWAMRNPARLELVPDKAGYKAGETASVQLRAPFPGKVLVSVEGQNIEYHDLVELHGNTGQVHIPVLESWQPNVYITATLVRRATDIAPGTPGRAFGAVPLFVDSLTNKMAVRVDAPAEIRPDSTLDLRITAQPGAQVTVAVVDEGILQLAGKANPDPFAHFYAKRSLAVTSYDNFALLFPHIGQARPLDGGDEALASASSFLRTEGIRRANPVTFWSGVLTADASGMLSYSVPVPAFQGALRIVAVAAKDKAFGSSQALTRVRTPLVLTPTLPRFVHTGDELDIPLTLRNDTPKAGLFTFEASIHGPATLGPVPEPVMIEPGQEHTVYLPLVCGTESGPLVLLGAASGNGESGRFREELNQRAPLPPVRALHTTVLREPRATLVQTVPENLVPASVRHTVRLSTRPLLRLSLRLDELLAYPYGCAEQSVSRVFPLLYFGALAQEMAPGHFTQAGPAGLVHTAIRRVQTMQTTSGGYAPWPGETEPDPWVSVYVCHFLLEARQAGHSIPGRMLDQGLNYVRSLATPEPDAPLLRIEQAAYAQYVLASAGQADLGAQDYLRSTFDTALNGISRTLLAGAYVAAGQADTGFALLHKNPDSADQRQDSGGNLGSGLRDRALIALILQAALPDDPRLPELITRISADIDADRSLSTQETSLALLALGKYLARYDSTQPLNLTLTWPEGQRVITGQLTAVEADIPTHGPITVERLGPDNGADIFCTVLTTGTPLVSAHTPKAQGLRIGQSILDEHGQPADLTALRQGQLLVMKTMLCSTTGTVDNVVVQSVLPPGLEIENPRLASTERLDWMPQDQLLEGYQDLRDDRILFFTQAHDTWRVAYSVLRAVTPGRMTLPPAQAEAMYHPDLYAVEDIRQVRILPNP
ncbi:MAG: alpha-2-macroglobulin family protein, partial [Desulfovibrionales bacterium]|nr:alpha-2-macroglobulin family protein [Desulfovibrionales bacterium]